MYSKVINPKTNGQNAYSNRGSARQAANYLEHEAKVLGEKAVFFNRENAALNGDEAVTLLDGNRKGLRADDAKFYSLVISPSEKDLEHIGNDPAKLRAYTQDVMHAYAENFNLKDGRKLAEKDLVWVATQHNQRIARGTDNQEQGTQKQGLQTHIHIMVSARDRAQKVTLNPLGTVQRFNQVKFSATSNVVFDAKFDRVKTTQQGLRQSAERPQVSAQSIKIKEADIRSRMDMNARNPAKSRATARGSSPRSTGENHRSTRQQRPAQPLTAAQEEARENRLKAQVDRINLMLSSSSQLDDEQVNAAAKSRDFDWLFYSRLGRIDRDATAGKPPIDPYQYLRSSRVTKAPSPMEATPMPPPAPRKIADYGVIAGNNPTGKRPSVYEQHAQSVTGALRNMAAAIAPTTRTQDIRGEQEKKQEPEQQER